MDEEGNKRTRARIRDGAYYITTFPDGRSKEMIGERIKALQHWKHCDVTFSRDYITFTWRPEAFSYGGGSATDHYRAAKNNLRTKKRQLIVAAQAIERDERMLTDIKRHTVVAMKQRSKYSYDRLREVLMADETVLDVRMPGEAWEGTAIGVGGYAGGRDSMMVTFVGPCIRGQRGVVPLPPVQYVLFDNGGFTGGPLAIHPHVGPESSCPGSVYAVMNQIREAGDTFAAVDMLRTLRLAYYAHSLLMRNWKRDAWAWWCGRFSAGWPTTEPFQKPWLARGMFMQDNRGGNFKTLSEVLGTEDPRETLTALHVGEMAGWYSRAAYRERLATMTTYAPRGEGAPVTVVPRCRCAAIPPQELENIPPPEAGNPLACSCHAAGSRRQGQTVSEHPCPLCFMPARNCRCPWQIRADWIPINSTALYNCERTGCGVISRTDMWQLNTFSLSGLGTAVYRICACCLPEEGAAVIQSSAPALDSVAVVRDEDEEIDEPEPEGEEYPCMNCGAARVGEERCDCGHCCEECSAQEQDEEADAEQQEREREEAEAQADRDREAERAALAYEQDLEQRRQAGLDAELAARRITIDFTRRTDANTQPSALAESEAHDPLRSTSPQDA